MRAHDNLGKIVPLNRSYILVFGGRYRVKHLVSDPVSSQDLDIYLNCETLLANIPTTSPNWSTELGSCFEGQFNQLWRYDTVDDTWELMKPSSDEDPTAATSIIDTYPYGRYGHAATLVDISASDDPEGYRRKYMFILGGISNNCLNGLCSDLWRYDIPWAAEAAWPINGAISLEDYKRGNRWKKMTSCPYGGRFRHSMISTENGDALYIYGGQMDSSFDDHLLVYHTGSGLWESLDTAAYRYFTRTVTNYGGSIIQTNLTDFSIFNPLTDKVGQLGYYTVMDQYNEFPPFFPVGRGDMCMIGYTERVVVNSTFTTVSPRVFVTSGFRTYSMPYPKTNAADTPYPTLPYYLDEDDVWIYDSFTTIWKQVFVTKDKRTGKIAPSPRRGAASVVIPGKNGNRTNDVLLMMGGNKADSLLGDMWGLNHRSNSVDGRKWVRIDDKIPGSIRPPNVTFHTMNHDTTTGKLYVYGGLRWTPTNLTDSDSNIDVDKNCFMAARGIMKSSCAENPSDEGCALNAVKEQIISACNNAAEIAAAAAANGDDTSSGSSSSAAFCCDSLPQFSYISRLQTLASTCTAECQSKSFVYQQSYGFGEGMWVLNPNACANDCSGNGVCKFSQCICQPGWTGSDCSVKTCPGSFCYIDTRTLEVRCNECSGNGLCGTDMEGICKCNYGWTGSDCSTVPCGTNCTSHGQCIPDFPINQCVCDRPFSGANCEFKLCLNNCSNSGFCQLDGSCNCSRNFFGEDCSVYMPTADGVGRYGSVVLAVSAMTMLALF